MKTEVLSTLCLAAVLASSHCAAGNLFSSKSCNPLFHEEKSPNSTWSGSWEDVLAVAEQWESDKSIEASTFAGVNVLNLIPYEAKELSKNNKANKEKTFIKQRQGFGDAYHQGHPGGVVEKVILSRLFHINDKWVSEDGSEVVFNERTGQIVLDGNLGTFNRVPGGVFTFFQHKNQDMDPWNASRKKDIEKMMYVGMVYKSDEQDPNLFYFVDANTGQPLTRAEVQDSPATINRYFQMCWENERFRSQAIDDSPIEAGVQTSEIEGVSSEAEGNDATDDSPQGDDDSQGDTSGMTPKEVASEFFKALLVCDDERAFALSAPESRDCVEMALVAVALAAAGQGASVAIVNFADAVAGGDGNVASPDQPERIKVEVGECTIKSETEAEAMVFWQNPEESWTSAIRLRKIDGAWKVVLTENDLLQNDARQ